MWQRFTERARRVILLGQEEAGKMDCGYVGSEHLLLGLVRENEGVAAQVLLKMGITLEAVRHEVESEAQPGNDAGGSEPKLTPKAKRVLELAADEARRLRHNYIGTEHLLLALLREKDGLAATVLRRLGLNLETARSQVMEYLSAETPETEKAVPTSTSPAPPPAPTARVSSDFRLTPDALLLLIMASVQAEQTMHKHTGVEHLLLAMLDYEAGEAAQFLQQMGVDLNTARAALRAKKEVRELARELDEVNLAKEDAINNHQYEKATELRDKANELEEKLAAAQEAWQSERTEEDGKADE